MNTVFYQKTPRGSFLDYLGQGQDLCSKVAKVITPLELKYLSSSSCHELKLQSFYLSKPPLPQL